MHFELNDSAEFFLAVGGILLLGMVTDYIGKKPHCLGLPYYCCLALLLAIKHSI